MTVGEGERLERERRRKFWRTIVVMAVVGGGSGLLFGSIYGQADGAGEPLSDTARLIAALALLIATLGAAFVSWRFFATIDEVEVGDNLWSALVGFYVYGFAFPTWWALSWLGAAPEPVDWILYAVVMLSTAATYGARKWRNR